MLAEKIIGSLHDEPYRHYKPDYVTIEWYEAFKKLHRKTTNSGLDIGIRLDNEVLTKGLNQDDILYIIDDENCIAVDIPPCEVIKITACDHHEHALVKAAYEIGNRHATAFWGEAYKEIIIPFDPPMLEMLSNIHGVIVETAVVKLDFDKRISASVHNHSH
jgi:urease accessory protein